MIFHLLCCVVHYRWLALFSTNRHSIYHHCHTTTIWMGVTLGQRIHYGHVTELMQQTNLSELQLQYNFENKWVIRYYCHHHCHWKTLACNIFEGLQDAVIGVWLWIELDEIPACQNAPRRLIINIPKDYCTTNILVVTKGWRERSSDDMMN